MVDKVELIDINPEYAHVRLPDGRETTVSVRHLAPAGASPSGVSPSGTSPPEKGNVGLDADKATTYYPRANVESSPTPTEASQGIQKPPSSETTIYSR